MNDCAACAAALETRVSAQKPRGRGKTCPVGTAPGAMVGLDSDCAPWYGVAINSCGPATGAAGFSGVAGQTLSMGAEC